MVGMFCVKLSFVYLRTSSSFLLLYVALLGRGFETRSATRDLHCLELLGSSIETSLKEALLRLRES